MTKLTYWFIQVENTNLEQFNTVTKTFMLYYADILNYFNDRSTNHLQNPLMLKLSTLE
ncbi:MULTISPECIES: transposase [unclassified Myroides]|uniref:transposase n=1 Tax=unclassified Myroides TaxID=2642485 RepID=UPI002575FBFE|nr:MULTISPECIES: transposase [unclassified Myroides]